LKKLQSLRLAVIIKRKVLKMSKKLLRLRAVQDWTGLSRSMIYALMQSGDFPKNIPLGSRAVGWLEADIQAWIESRISLKQAA
jgi:prophage regulatory protein